MYHIVQHRGVPCSLEFYSWYMYRNSCYKHVNVILAIFFTQNRIVAKLSVKVSSQKRIFCIYWNSDRSGGVWGVRPRDLDVLFVQARVHCDNLAQQIELNNDYDMAFVISPRKFQHFPLKGQIWYSKRELPHIFNISVFECDKNNSTAIKHIYNESVNLVDSYDLVWILPTMLSGISHKQCCLLAWSLCHTLML